MEFMSDEEMLRQALAQQKPEPAQAESEQKKAAPDKPDLSYAGRLTLLAVQKVGEALKRRDAKLKTALAERDEQIKLLQAAVADRDHQLDRHANHLMRISTKLSALEPRLAALERKAQP
jgi:uncharacterized coiled-coil protein SlyX